MYKFLVTSYRWITALVTMLVFGVISMVLVIISLGYLRNFCIQYIFKYSSRFILRIFGYSYVFPNISEFPKHQVMYIMNHNSYLDIYLLTGIGLANSRFILSEITYKYIPMVISAKAYGTFYIPQKKHPKRRLRFFKRITEILKRNNFSIITSPEGVSDYIHGINPFNTGIFHMALEANIPIIPLYIHIPEKANPFKGSYSKTGTIHLEVLKEIDNSNWKLESIRKEVDQVREVYVNRFNEINNTTNN